MNADIISYCADFPSLAVADLLKYLHQSCFGGGHLVTDEKRAVSAIQEELTNASLDCTHGVERLAGPFVRVHLNMLSSGLTPQTLGKLFVLSSQESVDSLPALNKKLDELRELSASGAIPFSESEINSAVDLWRKAGFAPCHHSEQFRKQYHPAYRVISEKYVRYFPLLSAIDARLQRGSLIVAIDGQCASGKTTLGALLAGLYDCNVFHMDDFFLQPYQRTVNRLARPGENVDHERFLEEVLLPARRGGAISYRRYDCHLAKIEDAVSIAPKKLTVVEGVYSLHDSLEAYYDLKVFSDVSAEVQKQRILARNGESSAKRFFDEWIPLEEQYFSACSVREKADIILP